MASTVSPHLQLLSNGRFHVMVTRSGEGYSRWKDIAVTRWREDAKNDRTGTFFYVSDLASGEAGSMTLQPTPLSVPGTPTHAGAVFSTGRATLHLRDFDIAARTDISVSPDADLDVRRVQLTNDSSARRTLAVTSYAEVVLESSAVDASHPAFEKLFVETEFLQAWQAIICTRRTRAPEEPACWMFHLLLPPDQPDAAISYETDRMRFVGRGRTLAQPCVLDTDAALSGSAGAVLDPIAAIRWRVVLDPGQSAVADWVSGIASSRDECLELMRKCREQDFASRVLATAVAHGQAMLARLQATDANATLYCRLAAPFLYADARLRATPEVLAQNHQGQSGLWAYSISGDLPIVLLNIPDGALMEIVRQVMKAHDYWRLHGLSADLVMLVAGPEIDRPDLFAAVIENIAACSDPSLVGKPGGLFPRAANTISEANLVLLQTAARVVIDASAGQLAAQLEQRCASIASAEKRRAMLRVEILRMA